jgi:hypothetical protein
MNTGVCQFTVEKLNTIVSPYTVAIYNYHPCWSVTRRFVSQRKERSPEGDLAFRGETNHWVTLQQYSENIRYNIHVSFCHVIPHLIYYCRNLKEI